MTSCKSEHNKAARKKGKARRRRQTDNERRLYFFCPYLHFLFYKIAPDLVKS
jgi:hypothetical protein